MIRRSALFACLVAVYLAGVCTAASAEAIVSVGAVNFTRGTISLTAQDFPSSVVRLELGTPAETLQSVEVPAGSLVTTFAPYRLRETTEFALRGYDSAGSLIWTATQTADPSFWRPHKPSLSARAEEVVPAEWDVKGSAGHPVTQLKAYCSQTEKTRTIRAYTAEDGVFRAEGLPVPFGRASFKIRALNGFGSSSPASIRVYNLGSALPHKYRYVLVSKGTFWMYHVRDDRVVKRWPIAIGMPWTPTPTGTFSIGAAQRSSGVWGPLRRPLRRYRSGHYYGSGYYIHGHAPGACWSIGQAASHGCVRMHNASIREFTRTVPNGTTVKIR